MNKVFDAVLLIGFGSPGTIDEVRPFLANVTCGRPVPEERIRDVIRRYEAIGGRSPYNELTRKLASAFREWPVYLGMRNWAPYLRDTLAQMKRDGVRRAVGFILAPHRTYSSFDQYLENVEAAKKESGFTKLEVTYVDPWHDHPLFIEAVADRVRWFPLEGTIIFTAHSLPLPMARQSRYEEEVETSSRLVAERLGYDQWRVAYQSRSGRPQDPWLGPDVKEVLGEVASRGGRRVVVVPIGFLCDHVEVLYDLDIDARQAAETLGLEFHRAETVIDHPKFIEMMRELIRSKMEVRVS